MSQIQNLIVAERLRNKGIVAKLVKEAIKFFKKKKYHELHVWTKKKNKTAIKLRFRKEYVLLEIEF